MKTEREWMEQLSGLNNPPLITVNRMAIREIQLDAMKEGMRRASKYIEPLRDGGLFNMRNAILTASENLTEKGL